MSNEVVVVMGPAAKPKSKSKGPAAARRKEIEPLDDLEPKVVKSRRLFVVQDSVEAAIDGVVMKWVVKTTNGDVTRGALYLERMEQYADHPFMKEQPWQKVGEAAIAAADALLEMRASMVQWKVGLDVKQTLAEFAGLKSRYESAMEELEDFEHSADRIDEKNKGAKQLEKSMKAGVVQSFYQQLVRDRLPKAIGKVHHTV